MALWIHSNDAEIIQYLEDKWIGPNNCYFETIICHHYEISEYYENKYHIEKPIYFEKRYLKLILKNYNFANINENQITKSAFIDLCHYDYYIPVCILLENDDIDLNNKQDISNFFLIIFIF